MAIKNYPIVSKVAVIRWPLYTILSVSAFNVLCQILRAIDVPQC